MLHVKWYDVLCHVVLTCVCGVVLCIKRCYVLGQGVFCYVSRFPYVHSVYVLCVMSYHNISRGVGRHNILDVTRCLGCHAVLGVSRVVVCVTRCRDITRCLGSVTCCWGCHAVSECHAVLS